MITEDRYARAARGWATGAARVYGPLARDLVAAAPHPLAGRRVLDVGAGTGLASAALAAAGARPVAVDLSPDMLAWTPPTGLRRRPARSTPCRWRDAAVDDVVAAFVLNHVSDPGAALAELIRVTRPGGALLASVYATTNHSAARDRIDDVVARPRLRPSGLVRPPQDRPGAAARRRPAMTAAARRRRARRRRRHQYDADIGLDRAPDLVDYRLGQAHVAAWLAGLDDRAAARAPRRGDRGRRPGDGAVPAARRPLVRPHPCPPPRRGAA